MGEVDVRVDNCISVWGIFNIFDFDRNFCLDNLFYSERMDNFWVVIGEFCSFVGGDDGY